MEREDKLYKIYCCYFDIKSGCAFILGAETIIAILICYFVRDDYSIAAFLLCLMITANNFIALFGIMKKNHHLLIPSIVSQIVCLVAEILVIFPFPPNFLDGALLLKIILFIIITPCIVFPIVIIWMCYEKIKEDKQGSINGSQSAEVA